MSPITIVNPRMQPCLGVSIVVIKYHDKTNSGRRGILSAYNSQVMRQHLGASGAQGKNLGHDRSHGQANAAYWLAPSGFLIVLFYITQDRLPSVGSTHRGLGSPTPITN